MKLFKKLLEKETPKKPKHQIVTKTMMSDYKSCPNCKCDFGESFMPDICPDCGQKIDWSGSNDL